MKALWMMMGLWIPMGIAQVPTILGTIPNRDNSKITFTTNQGECQKGEALAYAQFDGGKIGIMGCYRLIDSELFVRWSDGDVYTYHLDNLTFSPEFLDYVRKNP